MGDMEEIYLETKKSNTISNGSWDLV